MATLVAGQIPHNQILIYREEEREMLPLCADQTIAAIPTEETQRLAEIYLPHPVLGYV
ncbi:MAG: hypothetical protein Fur005_40530 [Roseiflexaceae bacterium]